MLFQAKREEPISSRWPHHYLCPCQGWKRGEVRAEEEKWWGMAAKVRTKWGRDRGDCSYWYYIYPSLKYSWSYCYSLYHTWAHNRGVFFFLQLVKPTGPRFLSSSPSGPLFHWHVTDLVITLAWSQVSVGSWWMNEWIDVLFSSEYLDGTCIIQIMDDRWFGLSDYFVGFLDFFLLLTFSLLFIYLIFPSSSVPWPWLRN